MGRTGTIWRRPARMTCTVAGAVLAVLLSACAGSSDRARPDESGGNRVISPGDRLEVAVDGNPELSAMVPVRADGRIFTPLVNGLLANGKSPIQLSHDIERRLKAYIEEPHVTVVVRNLIVSPEREIRVIGEAPEPQVIPYHDGMTMLDVMMTVKDLIHDAGGNRAIIVRHAGDRQEAIHVRLADLIQNGDVRQNVTMYPGDTLIIPPGSAPAQQPVPSLQSPSIAPESPVGI